MTTTRTIASEAAPSARVAPYRRQVLHRGGGVELMLARWHSGIPTLPHDHGGGRGRVLLLRGALHERRWASETLLQHGATPTEHTHAAGAELWVEPGTVHATAALCPGTLSLHIYCDEHRPMRLYQLDRRRVLLVRAGVGAWLPESARDIVEAWAWPGR